MGPVCVSFSGILWQPTGGHTQRAFSQNVAAHKAPGIEMTGKTSQLHTRVSKHEI